MNRRDLVTALRDAHYGEGAEVELPWARVDAALGAVLAVVKRRVSNGGSVFWRNVGVFSAVQCAARSRSVLLKGAAARVVRVYPAYVRVGYRRADYMDKLR